MLLTVCISAWTVYGFNKTIRILDSMQDVLFENKYELEKGGAVIEYFRDLPEADYSIKIKLLNNKDFFATYGLVKGDITKNAPYYVTENWIKSLKSFVFQKNKLFEETSSTNEDGSTSYSYTSARHTFNDNQKPNCKVFIQLYPL